MSEKTLNTEAFRTVYKLAEHLLERDGEHCFYCGVAFSEDTGLEIDHLKPLSKLGNPHSTKNTACACRPCNRIKHGNWGPEDLSELESIHPGRRFTKALMELECEDVRIDIAVFTHRYLSYKNGWCTTNWCETPEVKGRGGYCQDCADSRARWARTRKKQGLCVRCGGLRGKHGTGTYCKPCAERHNALDMARRERLISKGLCARCSGPNDGNNKWLCESCSRAHREYRKDWRQERKDDGVCDNCGEQIGPDGTSIYCFECAQRRKNKWKDRVGNGLCEQCGEPRGNEGTGTKCRRCADRSNTLGAGRRAKRIAEGLCVQCGEVKGDGSTKWFCAMCVKEHRAYCNRRNRERQASGLCVQCGEPRGEDGTKWHCRTCGNRGANNQKARNYSLQEAGLCRNCKQPRGDDGTKWECRECAKKFSEKGAKRAREATKKRAVESAAMADKLVASLCTTMRYPVMVLDAVRNNTVGRRALTSALKRAGWWHVSAKGGRNTVMVWMHGDFNRKDGGT